jgi:6-phosphogluconate dehydrogenase
VRIGFVGLGRMGGNMARRLVDRGHEVWAFDPGEDARRSAAEAGVEVVDSLGALVERLEPPRRLWVMVPAGDAVETTLGELRERCAAGDVVVDGGNSNFRDSRRRGAELEESGLAFCDVGVSGGVWGLGLGYCMMAGGDPAAIDALRPVLDDLAPPDGWLHVGPVGAGHYTKMVHNGIEYGLMQAYGEGFELLRAADFDADLPAIAHLWNQGSVVRSWLLELAERALAEDPDLERVRGWVEDSGEGRWTVDEAVARAVPAPVLTIALMQRFASRQDESFAAQVVAALRGQFGGHAVRHE